MTVSVVIPTHNRCDLLERAVNSVLSQTYKDLEVVVVSDGSTDNTDNIMKKYEKEFSNVKYIKIVPAQGANNARNEGIEASSGEYIAFLDDDDEWMKDKVEHQVSTFEANKSAGLVYTGINVVFVDENKAYYACSGYKGDLSKAILMRNVIGATPSVMIKREVLEKTGMFDVDLPAKQDYDLWIRICQVTEVDFVDKPLINYYNYAGSKQISRSTSNHEKAVEIIQGKYAYLFNTLTEQEKDIQQANYNISIANIALRNSNKKLAYKYSWKAFRHKANVKNLVYLMLVPVPYKWLLKIKGNA